VATLLLLGNAGAGNPIRHRRGFYRRLIIIERISTSRSPRGGAYSEEDLRALNQQGWWALWKTIEEERGRKAVDGWFSYIMLEYRRCG
jgi:hypothetical protein